MSLVKKYAKTKEGKAAIKEKTGLNYIPNITATKLTTYGEEMKKILFSKISQLIKSFLEEDIIVGQPYKDENGYWRVKLSFREEALRRNSLDTKYFPQGISNIVLLFARGYHANGRVYGSWVSPKFGYIGRVRSKPSREGSDFLIEAVDEFNKLYSKTIARAELEGVYKD